jgi:CRP/FNR family transcriptional regulator, cyclic AMP receptor protein
MKTRDTKSGKEPKLRNTFNATLLNSAGVAKRIVQYDKLQTIYSQGDPATSVIFIETGVVKLSVVNALGKEAILALLGPGDVFGEGCLAGKLTCSGTATAIAPTTALTIGKDEMIRILHADQTFSDQFISYMLSRNIRREEDFVDQLFNCGEKRLARTLLQLWGEHDRPQEAIGNLSQEALAEMIGTTRSRVNLFMSKFRKRGFIQYKGGLQVNDSLLSVLNT